MWRPYRAEDVAAVFTTESRQKSRELFLRTHQPISHLHVTHNRLGLQNDSFVSEQVLLDVIQSGNSGRSNRIFMLVGETGSGKSEVCQWLEYHLCGASVPLHVTRSQASTNGLITRLLSLGNPDAQFAISRPSAGLLADNLLSVLRLRAEQAGDSRLLMKIESLAPQIVTLAKDIEGGPVDSLSAYLRSMLDDAQHAPLVEGWLRAAVQHALGLDSLTEVLTQVVRDTNRQGKRLVLLLEDITSLGFMRDELLDYVFDLSVPGLDVVMGLTTGFESSHLSGSGSIADLSYVRDRTEARLALTNNVGETFFLTSPATLRDLVRRYVSCLPNWVDANGFGGLYPLSGTAVERLYVHLVESGNTRQTPRNLLDAIIRPLLSSAEPPYRTLLRPSPYLREMSFFFRRDGLSDDEVGLLYWYGDRNGQVILVPRPVSEAFGFCGVVSAAAWDLPRPESGIGLGSLTPGSVDEWRSALAELHRWRESGRVSVLSCRQMIKRGVQRLLKPQADPRELSNPACIASDALPIKYTRGGQKLPVYIHGSGDTEPSFARPALRVDMSHSPDTLEELLTLGYSPGGSLEVLADARGTLENLSAASIRFQQDVQGYLRSLLGITSSELALGAWWVSQVVGMGYSSDQLLDQRFLTDYGPARVRDFIDVKTLPGQADAIAIACAELMRTRDHYRGLFIAAFHAREHFVNSEDLQRAIEVFEPMKWIAAVAAVDMRKVRQSPFSQVQSAYSLADLVAPLVSLSRRIVSGGQALAIERIQRLSARLESLATYVSTASVRVDLAAEIEALDLDLARSGWIAKIPTRVPEFDYNEVRQVFEQATSAERIAVRDAACGVLLTWHWTKRIESFEVMQWDEEAASLIARVMRWVESMSITSSPTPGQDISRADHRLSGTLERLRGLLE